MGLAEASNHVWAELTQVSAHTGRESAGASPHASIEFWMIALHITVVVKRAYRSLVFVRLIPPHPHCVCNLFVVC